VSRARAPGSLRRRLFAAIALIVFCSLGLTLGVGLVLTRNSVEEATLSGLARRANLLAQKEREELLPFGRVESTQRSLARQGERLEVVPLARPSTLISDRNRAALRRSQPVEGSLEVDGERYVYAARRVDHRALVLLRPASLRESDWRPFAQGLLVAGLVGAALAAAVSLLLARTITRPVRRVAEATRSLAAGAAPDPIPVEGSDELAQLASSFNDMAVQLRRAREAERAFLLSVSHELKTPLTAIRGYAEGLADGAFTAERGARTILTEAGRLERLIHDLLDLARLNHNTFGVHREPIELAEAAREVVRRYEPQAAAFEVELHAEAPASAPALGDGDRVLQVLSNLVENALRSTPAGGAVRVVAAPGRVTVADTGPGLARDDLPRAFERFFLFERYRGRGRVGTGLGLAIVKELTEAMGGSVNVVSEPGTGTSFDVLLPLPAGVNGGVAEPEPAGIMASWTPAPGSSTSKRA